MRNKTKTLTNVMLTISLAFVVYISLDTQKEIKSLSSQMHSIEIRDQVYFERRMKILEDIEKQIEAEEELYQSF